MREAAHLPRCLAAEGGQEGTVPDTALEDSIRRLANQAVEVSRERFRVTLDYSEGSLEMVEGILGELHTGIRRGWLSRLFRRSIPPRQIQYMAGVWGAYVGEVIRRRWGGEWRRIASKGPGPRVALRVQGTTILPGTKTLNRLMRGPKENLWEYYQELREELERKSTRDVR